MKVAADTELVTSDSLNSLPQNLVAAAKPPRRMRRRFALAERLEPRRLLSAENGEAEVLVNGWSTLETENSHLAVDVATASDEGEAGLSSNKFRDPGFSGGGEVSINDLPHWLTSVADGAFLGSLANASLPSAERNNSGSLSLAGDDYLNLSDLAFANSSGLVELQSVQTGQVLIASNASAVSVQDGTGLTLADSSGPTAQVRTVDAEGRVVARTVLVKRAGRTESGAAPPVDRDAALAEHFEAGNAADFTMPGSSSTADVVDWATVLDGATSEQHQQAVVGQESSTIVLNDEDSDLKFGSGKPVGFVSRDGSKADGPQFSVSPILRTESGSGSGVLNSGAQIEQDRSASLDLDDVAVPAFEPRSREVLLSAVFLGWLAHLWNREQRTKDAKRRPRPGVELA